MLFDGVGLHAIQIVQCTSLVPMDDEQHHARLFSQVRDGLPQRRLCLELHSRGVHQALSSCASTFQRGGLDVAS
jgi:hypothetical protein